MPYKYVVMRAQSKEDPEEQRLIPVIFPSEFLHAQVFDALKSGSGNLVGYELTVESAGDCSILCHSVGGNSVSLNTKSRPEDVELIQYHPYTGGIV